MTSRKKPGVAFWATVALVVVLIGYPLSFGPACWISSHLNAGTRAVRVIYRPITWGLSDEYSGTLDSAIRWYARLCAANANWEWSSDEICRPEEGWVWQPLNPPP
jgi:hypothetical protein